MKFLIGRTYSINILSEGYSYSARNSVMFVFRCRAEELLDYIIVGA
jgi:hypothetical protein